MRWEISGGKSSRVGEGSIEKKRWVQKDDRDEPIKRHLELLQKELALPERDSILASWNGVGKEGSGKRKEPGVKGPQE